MHEFTVDELEILRSSLLLAKKDMEETIELSIELLDLAKNRLINHYDDKQTHKIYKETLEGYLGEKNKLKTINCLYSKLINITSDTIALK